MLVSCSYCNALHPRGALCNKRPKDSRTKEANYITAFRSSRAWQKKRDAIKTRDKSLCLYCASKGRYIFKGLSVHHIQPIYKKWNLRLEDSNLITLCRTCHELAEDGKISASELEKLVHFA